MTYAELDRIFASKKRTLQTEERRRAIFDYKLADLIGRSVARIHNSANKLPTIGEAYPTLFEEEADQEAIQEKQDQASALRFMLFAQSYNKRFKGGEVLSE